MSVINVTEIHTTVSWEVSLHMSPREPGLFRCFIKINWKSWRKVHLVVEGFLPEVHVHLCERGYDDLSLSY